MISGGLVGLTGCTGLQSGTPSPTPGKRFRLRVLNFYNSPVDLVIEVSQGSEEVYKETISLDGATGNEMRTFTNQIQLPRANSCTLSGERKGGGQKVSKTVRYGDIQQGYNFLVEEDGTLELWEAV